MLHFLEGAKIKIHPTPTPHGVAVAACIRFCSLRAIGSSVCLLPSSNGCWRL